MREAAVTIRREGRVEGLGQTKKPRNCSRGLRFGFEGSRLRGDDDYSSSPVRNAGANSGSGP